MLLLIESADWMEIPSNTIVCITPNMNVLSYPIVDEYHNDCLLYTSDAADEATIV